MLTKQDVLDYYRDYERWHREMAEAFKRTADRIDREPFDPDCPPFGIDAPIPVPPVLKE